MDMTYWVGYPGVGLGKWNGLLYGEGWKEVRVRWVALEYAVLTSLC